jgi:hypothetical protein
MKTYVNYYEYIHSAEWRKKSDSANRRAGYRCQICNSSDKILDAHHRTYERLGQEQPDDVTVLCRDCHQLYETNRRLVKPVRKAVFFPELDPGGMGYLTPPWVDDELPLPLAMLMELRTR